MTQELMPLQLVGRTILFADILGFAYDTRSSTDQFEGMLKQLNLFVTVKQLCPKYVKVTSFAFSDTVVAASDDNQQLFDFAQELFRQSWDMNILLRGAIASGSFYDLKNTPSLTNAPNNFIMMPIIGDGYTKAALMEKAGDGCRLFIDSSINTIPLSLSHKDNIRPLKNGDLQICPHLKPYAEYVWWNSNDKVKCSNMITVTQLAINNLTQEQIQLKSTRKESFDIVRDSEISYEINSLSRRLHHLNKTLEIMS